MTDFSINQYDIDIENLKQIPNKYSVKSRRAGKQGPFQVTWKGLTYKAKQSMFGIEKVILNNVSGYFKSGHITAIMGPSGSGKSTLLGCISGQKKTGLSGSVTISTDREVSVI